MARRRNDATPDDGPVVDRRRVDPIEMLRNE